MKSELFPRSTTEVDCFGFLRIGDDSYLQFLLAFGTILIMQLDGTHTHYTDEEVERSYEEFYEDVHTEFLKFGEIINFKVCRNGSFHLRGNVYVHYKSLDSAVMAFNSVHARYFAGKQVKCEYVSLTRWKVAICGEFMKSRLKTCSRGSACNFLHCFSNPGGDYEWADCDKPPPRYWVNKMIALFGYSEDSWHDKYIDQPSPKYQQHSARKTFTSNRDSHLKKRHQSMDTNQHNENSRRNYDDENHVGKSRRKKANKKYEEYETEYKRDNDSDVDQLDRRNRESSETRSRHTNKRNSKSRDYYDEDYYTEKRNVYTKRRSRHINVSESSSSSNDEYKSDDAKNKASRRSTRHHRRSTRHDHGEGVVDEVKDQEYENERFAKKPKRHNRKSTVDKSRSRESAYILDKNDISDRWEPDKQIEKGLDMHSK